MRLFETRLDEHEHITLRSYSSSTSGLKHGNAHPPSPFQPPTEFIQKSPSIESWKPCLKE